ncbi:MAG: hypothetical protein ACF8CQ_20875 [Rhodopirellula sp. JB044]|uniref:GHMP family kinase ATP-binding protein n=1 Tax=Rhodopirellula sp. JB044 TaxID=3342844 RepID=UPI00370A9C8F
MVTTLSSRCYATTTPVTSPKGGRSSLASSACQFTHWGELIQGPVKDQGEIVTGLITLPRYDMQCVATFTPNSGPLVVDPGWCCKAHRAALGVLDITGNSYLGGCLTVRSNIPFGCGAGATTADVTATIQAVSRAVDWDMSPRQVQQIDWEIERAADPLALIADGEVLLYGSRVGRTLQRLSHRLPAMRCLAFNPAPGQEVLTCEVASKTHYRLSEVNRFRSILSRAIAAIELGDVNELAAAATQSARLNQDRVPIVDFDINVDRCFKAGAAGMSVSHSGTVAAALFDPMLPDVQRRIETLADAFVASGYSDVSVFDV